MAQRLDLKSLVTQILRPPVEPVCRLCFGDTSQGLLKLCDDVVLETAYRSYCPVALTMADMLRSITQAEILDDPHRSDALCLNCSNNAINAYTFQQFCRYSNNKWLAVQNSLIGSVESPKLDSVTSKALLVLVDEKDTFAFVESREVKTTSQALRRAKTIRARFLKNPKNNPAVKDSMCDDVQKFQCDACGQCFRKEHLLKRHSVTHTLNLSCSVCSRSFSTKSKYNLHMARLHDEKKYKCPDCARHFGSEYLVDEHRKAVHVRGSCRYCGKMYTARKALKDHETSHRFEWTCVHCNKIYKYKDGLKLHMNRCTLANKEGTIEKFSCNECGKTYAMKQTLQLHIQYAHSENPISCPICYKKFLSQSVLRNHISKHTGVKNYKCRLCEGTFMTSTTLLYHMRALHTFEKPFPCDECPETFITSFRRVEHKRKCHGAPAPQCVICLRKFTTQTSLKKHLKRHESYRIEKATTYFESAAHIGSDKTKWIDSITGLILD